MKKYLLILTGVLLTFSVFGQRPQGGMSMQIDGEIYGKVLDKDLNTPVEYANVALYKLKDSSLVSGGITNSKGEFNLKKLPAGRFYMTVKFIGYNTTTKNNLMLHPRSTTVDAGTIQLSQAAVALDGVEVVADRIAMQYKIDKKVISVSQYSTASSGTAVDILEKTPSVNVDIEGNVELRGSTSFTVLIDGRPSPFDGGDALEQIPASSIENIEIITNPSAKYDPEGTAGIINIITKKSKFEGMSGIINSNIGLNDKYGADFLINYRTNKFNIFGGAEYNYRNFGGDRLIENITNINDTLHHNNSSGESYMIRKSYNIRTGFDYFLSKKTTISANVNYGFRSRDRINDLDYIQYNEPNTYNEEYSSLSNSMGGGDFISGTADFMHKFNTNGHELSGQVNYRLRNSISQSQTEQMQDELLITGQTNEENELSNSIRTKLDYVLPFGKKNKLEAGYQSNIENEEGGNLVEEYNPTTDAYELKPLYSHDTKSDKNIHALYSTLSGEIKGLGYMAGLRTEYTDRTIHLTDTDEKFEFNRWDFFPSAHLSYTLPKDHQVMASYSRRIRRPRSWFLEPYETYMDAYNIRAGNPSLKPQYINSFEAGYTKKFGRSFLSIEGFYKRTLNKIERVRRLAPEYGTNIFYNTFENIGYDEALGVEAMTNLSAFKWWNINVTGSLFNYKLTVESENIPNTNKESLNWNTRMSNTFMLAKSTRLQLDGMWISPSVTAQGRREGFYMVNAAVKQDLLKRKLTATLQVRDIFGGGKHEFYSSGPGYESYINFTRESPIVMLSLSYKLNNYKQKRKNGGNGGEEDSGDIFNP